MRIIRYVVLVPIIYGILPISPAIDCRQPNEWWIQDFSLVKKKNLYNYFEKEWKNIYEIQI